LQYRIDSHGHEPAADSGQWKLERNLLRRIDPNTVISPVVTYAVGLVWEGQH
jgi:hypothetical protein